MSQENNNGEDSRRELYERFSGDLIENRGAMFYDREDLVELYDYANDVEDRYVALEVLFCGERLYPGDVALAERRALYYYSLDEGACRKALAALPDDSMIGKLLALRLDRVDKDEASRTFAGLLMSRPEFTDEEIIQLADTAEELDMYEWLKEHKDAICAHTDYPQTFLYELSQIAMEQDPDYAVTILEELTMLEPFTADFWLSMAQVLISDHKALEKALDAIEFSLAIEPDNARALMMKAQCYNELDYPLDRVEPILRRVIDMSPHISAATLALALLYSNVGRKEEAMKMLFDYNSNYPGDPQVLEVLLTVSNGNLSQNLVKSFLKPELAPYRDNFVEMAEKLASEGLHGAAAILLTSLEEIYGLPHDLDLMMEALYRNNRYEEIIARYDGLRHKDAIGAYPTELSERMATFYYLMSRIRMGMLSGLREKVKGLKENTSGGPDTPIDDLMRSSVMLSLFSAIENLLEQHADGSEITVEEINEIDPFGNLK